MKTIDSAPSTVTYATTGDLRTVTVTDSVAGTFTGTYNADGALTSETLPGNYTLTVRVSEVRAPSALYVPVKVPATESVTVTVRRSPVVA